MIVTFIAPDGRTIVQECLYVKAILDAYPCGIHTDGKSFDCVGDVPTMVKGLHIKPMTGDGEEVFIPCSSPHGALSLAYTNGRLDLTIYQDSYDVGEFEFNH